MKRRDFILYSALTTVSVTVPFLSCTDKEPKNKLAFPATLAQLMDKDDIKAIGATYGKTYPQEYSEEKLRQKLRQNDQGKIIDSNASKEINDLLAQKIQKDFETEKTMVIEGWVISQTEARQCALFTLTA